MLNTAVAGSSTREARLGNNIARARVAVTDASGVRDRCAITDGRASRGARAAAC